MLIQNSTSAAVTRSPLDQAYDLSLIVMVRPPSVYTGSCARLRSALSPGPPALLPNQYSGRYISCWNAPALITLKLPIGVSGQIQFGTVFGGSAQVAVSAAFPGGLPPGDDPLVEQAVAASTATVRAAPTRHQTHP